MRSTAWMISVIIFFSQALPPLAVRAARGRFSLGRGQACSVFAPVNGAARLPPAISSVTQGSEDPKDSSNRP